MAKNGALTPNHKAIGTLGVLWGANYLAGHYFGWPFLYCLAAPVARTLYMAYGLVILYLVAAFTLLALLRGNLVSACGGAVIFISVIELPRLVSTLFMTGGSCE